MLHGVGALDNFFLEGSIILLELSQGLFLLVGVDKRFVVFVFVLLPVDCLKVAFFCVSLLDVEFLLELEIVDLGVHFDDVVPEDFFLVKGLLYFADGQIGGIEHSFKCALESLAHKFLVMGVGSLPACELFSLILQKAESTIKYSLKLDMHWWYLLFLSLRLL